MISNFLNAIKNFFIGVFCFLINMMLAVFVCTSIEQGGLGYHGLFGVLAFLLLLFIFIKVSKIGSTIFGCIVYFFLRIRVAGTDNITELIMDEEFIKMVFLLIGLLVFMSFLGKSSNPSKQQERTDHSDVCPRCGRTMVFVPAREVPTGSGELVDGKGEWVYDYSDSQTKSTWVVPKVRVYESKTVPAHYECPHCGYSER